MATDEEMAHLRKLLLIYQDRRRDAEEKVAYHGRGHLPAEVALDIKEIDESIARIQARMLALSVPLEVQEATGPEAGLDVLRTHVKHLSEKLDTALRWMTTEILAMREEAREHRTRNDRERRVWQKMNFALLLLIVALIAFELGTRR